ncbi:hypothetical protein [Pseudonocardia spinosispora]|uniref:hypothetical protein n=1 Tax=Pseudonocardia spinosispora TaxID=103441 RepID=UPI00041F0AC6|nr:hypothetical protein [Pseudonocardia spinosispora]
MSDQVPLSSAELLYRRLLVSRTVDEPRPRRQPVVVLLGPAGSGKTRSLRAISEDCGPGVVHARFDFASAPARTEPVTTVEVLSDLAYQLSRKWANRGPARFTRLALGLLAVQAKLSNDHSKASDELGALIRDWSRVPHADRTADLVGALLDAAEAIPGVPESVVRALRPTLPELIRTVVRKPLRGAHQWHADIPEAQGATPKDALLTLHDIARRDVATMTSWLTQAFLADARESHPRMARTEPGAPCSCQEPRRHQHAWVLLLDNLDHPGGAEFVADLANARQRHTDHHPDDHDALLIVASSGRWNADWESDWRVPWRAAPIGHDGLATIPRCGAAKYQHWAASTAQPVPPVYYPVLLEPLDLQETARLLDIDATADPRCVLARRATGGLPMAVEVLRPLLRGGRLDPGSRTLLGPSSVRQQFPGDEPREADPWHERLVKLRLHTQFDGLSISDFVSAAPFATAPWLIPDSAPSLITAPRVGQILTELRAALWVTAPVEGGATANHAELHPWVAQTLVSALAARPRSLTHDYPTQFTKLLADQSDDGERTEDDLVRIAYCWLALGRFSDVVSYFTAHFDRGPHQEWIDRLRLVATAPSSQPHDHPTAVLFDQLVNSDAEQHPERTDVRNVVTRLVAGLWLARSPFTMPDPAQWHAIAEEYRRLPGKSRRPDVSALNTAAAKATRGIL